jgi:hypothetical protein
MASPERRQSPTLDEEVIEAGLHAIEEDPDLSPIAGALRELLSRPDIPSSAELLVAIQSDGNQED